MVTNKLCRVLLLFSLLQGRRWDRSEVKDGQRNERRRGTDSWNAFECQLAAGLVANDCGDRVQEGLHDAKVLLRGEQEE